MIYLVVSNIFLIVMLVICILNKCLRSRRNQTIFERFIQHMNIGYFRYRAGDGVIVSANEGFLDIIEVDIQLTDVIGKTLGELIIYSEQEDTLRHRLKEYGQLWNYEYSFRTLKGRNKYVVRNSIMKKDPYSGQEVIEALMQDVTEQRSAYDRMKESQERYEKLFKNSGDMVFICALDGMTMEEINPITELISGFRAEEVVGQPLENLLHPYYRKKLHDLRQDLLFKGSSESETVIVCRDGRYKEVLMTASLVELGDQSKVIIIVKDISGIIKDREEQKLRNKELEDFCRAAVEREERIRELNVEIDKLRGEIAVLKGHYGHGQE